MKKRREAVRARYVGKRDGAVAAGRTTAYPLSGILHCASCGASMVISSGSSAHYYRCGDHKRRGTCANALALREDVARKCILGSLRERFTTPKHMKYLREKIAHVLGEASRSANRELAERRERLARTEARIAKLIDFIAAGNDSAYVKDALRDLEAQARAEKDAIAAIGAQAALPVRLPTPDDVLRWWEQLEQLFTTDAVLAREGLRRLFRGGKLMLTPQPEGYYTASGGFLPLMALDAAERVASLSTRKPRGTSIGCAGRI